MTDQTNLSTIPAQREPSRLANFWSGFVHAMKSNPLTAFAMLLFSLFVIAAIFGDDCELRGDETAVSIAPSIKPATDEDWGTEYLDPIASVKVVDGLDEAIDWVDTYSSHHTDAIITEDDDAARKFMTSIDSAILMHNASTQFADGGEFGLGAEIGIATGKMHARGPVGLEQLTSFKYLVHGNGQTRP